MWNGLALVLATMPTAASLQSIIDKVRVENHLPCLIMGVRLGSQTIVVASGTVAADSAIAVSPASKVHLGSNTKAITAMLVAREVAAGAVSWTTTVGSLFPDVAMPDQLAHCTFLDLLSHTSGLNAESYPKSADPERMETWFRDGRSEVDQHATYLADIARLPMGPLGVFHYANGNYVVAAAMLEKATGKRYTDLVRQEVFNPLHMESAGFGAPAGPNDPWPHLLRGGAFVPVSPAQGGKVTNDNAPVITPAGRVHMTMADHLKFAAVLWGDAPKRFLGPGALETLTTSRSKAGYALGWIVIDRSWGGGLVMSHTGSNTMNTETIWVAPKRQFAVAAYTNVAGANIPGILDSAIGGAITATLGH